MENIKDKPKVFYSKELSSKDLLEISQLVSKNLSGKIGIKINTKKNIKEKNINPEFYRPLINYLQGTVIDSNSLLPSEENNFKDFSKYFNTEILDKNTPDEEIEILEGKKLKKIYVGQNLKKYDSFIIISNYSNYCDKNELGVGALFQLSFELSSKKGKTLLLTGGKTDDFNDIKNNKCDSKIFQESSAEAANSIFNYIKKNAIFINLLPETGILASVDPVSVDKACNDLINDADKESDYNNKYLIECCEKLGIGKKDYELIYINK